MIFQNSVNLEAKLVQPIAFWQCSFSTILPLGLHIECYNYILKTSLGLIHASHFYKNEQEALNRRPISVVRLLYSKVITIMLYLTGLLKEPKEIIYVELFYKLNSHTWNMFYRYVILHKSVIQKFKVQTVQITLEE